MPSAKQLFGYYIFSLSNFLAAFGGGMILGKGIGIINIPLLQNGSVMAFFMGAALGLALLKVTPKICYTKLTGYFSICCALTSLILFYIFEKYSSNNKINDIPALVFFTGLSLRFGFWFYSRALRAANTAGQQQRIAWVELGYYVGMIFGLIIWEFLNLKVGLATALLIDSALQFSAGMLDLNANRINHNHKQNTKPTPHGFTETQYANIWKWKLIIAVVLLTVGTQVVIFSLAHNSNNLSAYILATFYLGASIGAFICKKLKVQLMWKPAENKKMGYAALCIDIIGMKKEINIILLSIISLSSVIMVVTEALNSSFLITKKIVLLFFVFCAAFFYEILALGILDRIGQEEKTFNHQGMVIRAYGMMSIFAAISLGLLGLANNALFGLLFATGICILSAGFIMRRRVLFI